MNQVADLHDLELIWPSLGPTDVIVTGTFDEWSRSTHLVKGNAGFHGTVKVPWGEKIAYKFLVDGRWQCREDRPQEDDEHGNTNNVLRTPEKVVPNPPARLSIPLQPDAQSDGQDVDNMVTALESLPPVEPAAPRVPLSIPHITVDGHSLVPTPVSESKLDSAAATEGTVPTSVTTTPNKQAPTSYDVFTPAINDNGSPSLPPINGDGEVHDLHSSSTQPGGIQFAQAELSTSSEVPETAEEEEVLQGSAVSQPSHSTQDAQDVPLAAEPTAKQFRGDSSTAARASTSSDAPSSTSPHKKRRSLLARIKHMFDKHKEKREKKEKNGH